MFPNSHILGFSPGHTPHQRHLTFPDLHLSIRKMGVIAIVFASWVIMRSDDVSTGTVMSTCSALSTNAHPTDRSSSQKSPTWEAHFLSGFYLPQICIFLIVVHKLRKRPCEPSLWLTLESARNFCVVCACVTGAWLLCRVPRPKAGCSGISSCSPSGPRPVREVSVDCGSACRGHSRPHR